jgi:hypothetical protein
VLETSFVVRLIILLEEGVSSLWIVLLFIRNSRVSLIFNSINAPEGTIEVTLK